MVDDIDAGQVGDLAQHRGAYSRHSKGKAKEQPRDHANLSGNQFLREHHNRREGGGQDEADYDAEDAGPKEINVRQYQRERHTPRIEHQMTYLRPMRSPIGPPIRVPAAVEPRKKKR